jgi:uncharacterized protein YggU (UPF0235/DUF167 family)
LPRIESHRKAVPAAGTMPLRVTVKVKPGSRRPGISRSEATLVIAVRERAIDGQANLAVCAALAAWLGIAASRVTIEHGASGRTKRLTIDGLEEPAYAAKLASL